MCVVQRLLFTLLQFLKTYQLTYTAILRLLDHIRLRCCCLQGTASSASASTGASTANQYSKCARVRRAGRTARVRAIVLLPRNVTAPSAM